MWLLLFIIFIISYLFFNSTKSRYKHLPSPGLCLPILGHSYKLLGSKDLVNSIWSVYKKHNRNGILYIQSFREPSVWIGDFEAIKYLFNHIDGNDRTDSLMRKSLLHTRKVTSGNTMPGLLFSEGSLWHQQRRFTLKTLKDFGFGKQGMEGLIHEEVNQFISFVNTNIDQPLDFSHKLNLPIINALWKITVGDRFEYDNPKLLNIVERLTECFKLISDPKQAILRSFPWVEKLPLPESVFKRKYFVSTLHEISDMMMDNIIKHKETLDVNSPRDFVDMMLIEMENTEDESSSFYGQLGFDNLKVTMFDLFLAGSETTSTTLTWAFLYMIR